MLLLLGLAAVLSGSALVFVISHTFTRPLASLVDGVRALEHGDFHHPLDPRGSDEVAELTSAFDRMRSSLLKTQQALLESEQLATIGRMASSISHDLRHSLAAVVANSEFLCDGRLSAAQREELYQEVRTGVNQMTDLIDSLLEFARTRESLNPTYASVVETVQRAMQAVRLHPRHQGTLIEVLSNGQSSAWFDPRKLERALYNLLLNACEAAPSKEGKVRVAISRTGSWVTIAVSDNGPGIAEPIHDKLFHPFVSYGKENGTGLGLAVVQKIVQDHGGEVSVERTADAHTVFRITIPGRAPQGSADADAYDNSSRDAYTRRQHEPELNSTFGYVSRAYCDFKIIRVSLRRKCDDNPLTKTKTTKTLALWTTATTAAAFVLLCAAVWRRKTTPRLLRPAMLRCANSTRKCANCAN